MKKIYLMGIILLTLIFISGCNLFGGQVTPVCNKPYILVGTECCLDQNDNAICDKDESIKEELSQNNITEKEDIKTSFTDVINDAIKKVVKIEIKLPYKGSYASGFFVDSNGYVVTNYHVIEGLTMEDINKHLVIHTYSGDSYDDVEIAGYNYNYDIALLKINTTKKLDIFNFGDSNDLKVGTKVYALGNPRGLNFSVSSGIISAKNRAGLNNQNINNYLQTDASVNPGNSGGPLIDESGKVFGINTFGSAPWYAQGLNFALESNKIKELVNNMIYTSRYSGLNREFYQIDFNKKINNRFVGEFDIRHQAKENQYITLFDSFIITLNNEDEINHEVCFDLKTIYGGVQNFTKRLEKRFDLKQNRQITEDIPISIMVGYNDGRDLYFEIKVVECKTDKIYGEAIMRKYYTFNLDDKGREILVI